MAVLQEYKCPCCGGAIAFDSTLQKMKCPYCDTEFEMETLQGYDEALRGEQPDQMQWDTSGVEQLNESEADGLRTYVCKSCGGEIVGDENMAATSCPFCGNAVVMMEKFSGMLKPDLVIPFKLDKEAAKRALTKHYSGRRLLPKLFKDENHIDEIKGVYVPFWLFDAEADASIRYRATRIRSWSSGDYDYTETQHYFVFRDGQVGFEAVPVDGSTKMPDDMMESIEPYDLSQAVDFQTAYLAGYLADKYDVDAEKSVERANDRLKKSTQELFAATVKGFTTVTPESSSIRLSGARVRYALYPVWLLNTSWNGHTYTFAMNGQTGRLVGDLPVDKSIRNRYFGLFAAAFTAAAVAVQALLWLL